MRTLEDIRASLEAQPEPKPEHQKTVEVPVVGFGNVKVTATQSYVHLQVVTTNVAMTRNESLDVAAALIYQAQKARG